MSYGDITLRELFCAIKHILNLSKPIEFEQKISEVEAQEIIEAIAGLSFSDIFLHPDRIISHLEKERILNAALRVAKEEPIAYVLQRKFFFDHHFYIDSRALIPRADSEVLVRYLLRDDARWRFILKHNYKPNNNFTAKNNEQFINCDINTPSSINYEQEIRILDICSGSGCLLLSLCATILAHSNRKIKVYGTGLDISAEANEVAKLNAQKMDLSHLCEFFLYDVLRFPAIDLNITINLNIDTKFDYIVANPPYIPLDEYSLLDSSVRNYEPRIALTDEHDGCQFYRAIFEIAGLFLVSDGELVVEVCSRRWEKIAVMASQYDLELKKTLHDISRNVRALVFRTSTLQKDNNA